MRFVVLLNLNVLLGFIVFFHVVGGTLGSRTLSAAHHHRGISNPVPYHPAHVPSCYYIVNTLLCQQLFGGDDRDRTCCDVSRRIYSPLPYHYGGISRIVWWTEGESNSQLRLAKPRLSHLTTSPKSVLEETLKSNQCF